MTMLEDLSLARLLADEAGKILLHLRCDSSLRDLALGDAGDRAANAYLMRTLRAQRPHDGLLSEEETDNAARLSKSRVWIIDPLDGTREYREGRADWAVHIALCVDGAPHVCAVSLPSKDALFTTGDGTKFHADAAVPPRRLRIAVSRTRPPKEAEQLVKRLSAAQIELVPMGSAGAKAMAVITGEVDAYIHAGGQREWDAAAPIGVALAAGLCATHLNGAAVRFNQVGARTEDYLIAPSAVHAYLLANLRSD